MAQDNIRVLRVIEYSGPRAEVEKQLQLSQRDGTHEFNKRNGVRVKIATIGDFPEILEKEES